MLILRNLVLVILIATFSWGCSVDAFIDSKLVQPKKSSSFKVSNMGSNWNALKDSIADVAYVNKKNGATISLNSTCEKYEDNPLKQLMYNLLANMEDTSWEKDEYIKLDGREAYKVTLNAKADGVPIRAQAIVLRKNFCVYDFIYTAERKAFNNTLKEFTNFVGSFHAW
jgi:hypothetical protein